METGRICLHRSAGSVTYPARFQLIMAANPCPCGMNIGAATGCTCSVVQRRGYLSRLSGPLLDRMDLQVTVERPRSASMALSASGERSHQVLRRVVRARDAQRDRLSRWGICANNEVPLSLLSGDLRLPPSATAAVDRSLDCALISLRGYVRVLRLAWTLADLTLKDRPDADDVDIALQLRQRATE